MQSAYTFTYTYTAPFAFMIIHMRKAQAKLGAGSEVPSQVHEPCAACVCVCERGNALLGMIVNEWRGERREHR